MSHTRPRIGSRPTVPVSVPIQLGVAPDRIPNFPDGWIITRIIWQTAGTNAAPVPVAPDEPVQVELPWTLEAFPILRVPAGWGGLPVRIDPNRHLNLNNAVGTLPFSNVFVSKALQQAPVVEASGVLWFVCEIPTCEEE